MTMRERSRDARRPRVMPLRHGQLKKSHPLLGLLRIAGISVAVLAVAAASVGGIAIWDVTSSIKPGIHLATLPGQTEAPPQIGAIEGGVNLLLAGTDTRTG